MLSSEKLDPVAFLCAREALCAINVESMTSCNSNSLHSGKECLLPLSLGANTLCFKAPSEALLQYYTDLRGRSPLFFSTEPIT